MRPRDCIFGYERPLGWLHNNTPTLGDIPSRQRFRTRHLLNLLNMSVKMKLPYRYAAQSTRPVRNFTYGADDNLVVELEQYEPVRANAGIMRNISLDSAQGQFDGILGMYQMQARLMALEVIAVQRRT